MSIMSRFLLICTAFTLCLSAPAMAEDSKTANKEEMKKWEKQMMQKIPFAEELRPVYKLVKGDTDLLGIQNLRADRRNKGIEYKTNGVLFMDNMDHMHWTFEAGDDTALSFETNHMPLVGAVDGFKLHGSVSDESRIFARYTMSLDFLK